VFIGMVLYVGMMLWTGLMFVICMMPLFWS